MFSGAGEVPQNLRQVAERAKDIQYASKTRFNSTHIKELEELRASLRRVLDKLPPEIQSDPDVQRLAAVSTRGDRAGALRQPPQHAIIRFQGLRVFAGDRDGVMGRRA